MSTKRTSTESNYDDDQTNEGSELLGIEGNAKRARLDSLRDTTLQDLPTEILERILVKAVLMEVIGLKLPKKVWKAKADLVLSRLGTVCPQWSNILTNKLIRSEVWGTLDGTAEKTIRLELLQQTVIQSEVFQVTTMKDEIFMLRKQYQQVNVAVYDRNNTAFVKDVIALPGKSPVDIAGCSVSNCVYVLNVEANCYSVLRIEKYDEHQFNVSPWIGNLSLPISTMSVSSAGDLVILSRGHISTEIISSLQSIPTSSRVGIYNANGSMRKELILPPNTFGIKDLFSVSQQPNGNLVLASLAKRINLLLTEMDQNGRILRQSQPGVWGLFDQRLTLLSDRILINDRRKKFELLDSEFNQLKFTGQELLDGPFILPSKLHYTRERNEIMRICHVIGAAFGTRVLSIFRFTEE